MDIFKVSPAINPSRICFLPRNTINNIPPNYYSNLSTPTWSNIISPRRPNILLLFPALLGSAAAFTIGFAWFGHALSGGYNKYIFFINVYAIIASIGAGVYIFEVLGEETGRARFKRIILPLIIIVVFYALIYNLTYTLYPFTYSGTIGDTPITQFLSFLSLSVGDISVGEAYNINQEKTGTQVLSAIESIWNLLVLSLLIALIAF